MIACPCRSTAPRAALLALVLLLAASAHAQLTVKDPWVRGTVAQQRSTGMFAQLVSASGGRLVAASSPVAAVVEIHEMTMDGNVMRMRAVDGIALPSGKTVELKPGGHHVMLMELRQPLKAGETVPVTLVVEGAGGRRETVEVKAAVRPLNAAPGAAGSPAGASGHSGHKH